VKNVLLVALAVTQLLSSNAEAKKRGQDITVTAPLTVKVWAQGLTRRLDDALQYPTGLTIYNPNHAFARVQFSLNADGSIRDMYLVRKSGSRALDKAALKAVLKLDRISAMPTSITPGRLIEAHLLFAQSEEQLRDVAAANKAFGRTPSNQVASATDKPLLLASLAMASNYSLE
jgi:TonB family protein